MQTIFFLIDCLLDSTSSDLGFLEQEKEIAKKKKNFPTGKGINYICGTCLFFIRLLQLQAILLHKI
jgi:hypothetical protein